MKLITNNDKKNNHEQVITKLIEISEVIVICSGWMKMGGLKLVLPSLNKAIKNNADITIYSDGATTKTKTLIDKVKSIKGVKHFITDGGRPVHSKIFYFESKGGFTSIIGSANITKGGLSSNDELSVLFNGDVGSHEHNMVVEYLEKLHKNTRFKLNT